MIVKNMFIPTCRNIIYHKDNDTKIQLNSIKAIKSYDRHILDDSRDYYVYHMKSWEELVGEGIVSYETQVKGKEILLNLTFLE